MATKQTLRPVVLAAIVKHSPAHIDTIITATGLKKKQCANMISLLIDTGDVIRGPKNWVGVPGANFAGCDAPEIKTARAPLIVELDRQHRESTKTLGATFARELTEKPPEPARSTADYVKDFQESARIAARIGATIPALIPPTGPTIRAATLPDGTVIILTDDRVTAELTSAEAAAVRALLA